MRSRSLSRGAATSDAITLKGLELTTLERCLVDGLSSGGNSRVQAMKLQRVV